MDSIFLSLVAGLVVLAIAVVLFRRRSRRQRHLEDKPSRIDLFGGDRE